MTRPPRTAPRPEHLLARDMRAGWDRLVAVTRRRPLLGDAALAAAVLVLSVPQAITPSGGVHVLSLGLFAAEAVLLVARRLYPFGVFWLILVLVVVQADTTGVNGNFLLVAFYTVAAYEPPRRVMLAAAALAVGAVLLPFAGAGVKDWVRVFGILSLCALYAAAGLFGYYVRTRRAALEALADQAERLRYERDQQAQLAAAAERARIAREVHDIVAHNIAVMIALADGAAYTAGASPGQSASPGQRPVMGQVSATGRSALAEMRRLVGVLRDPAEPGHAPQPGLDDVEELIATVRAAGLPARLTVAGPPFPLPPSAQLALYRITQEALTNTLKHAPGATAEVRMAYRPGQVELEVTDDGRPGGVRAGGEPAARAGRPRHRRHAGTGRHLRRAGGRRAGARRRLAGAYHAAARPGPGARGR